MKIIKGKEFEGYLNFICQFDEKVIDEFISLDLQNDKPQQYNQKGLIGEIQRIRFILNIEQ
ncbi:hypothetical protein pb186bvf_002642 [Paramecium bursaria]